MGSLFRRANEKKWSIAWQDEHGRRRCKRASADKRVAAEELRQLEGRVERIRLGMPVADAAPQRAITAALADYRAELLTLGRTSHYVESAIATLGRLASACSWHDVADIAPDPFARALAELVQSGLALSSRNVYQTRMVAFAEWCIDRGLLERNPLERVAKAREPSDPSQRPRAKRAFTLAEFERLTSCPKIRARRRQLYRIAGLSGLRLGELGQLERQDFTLGQQPTWHLRAAITKARRRDEVPMLPECAAALAELCFGKGPTDRLFRNRSHQWTMRADLARAGVPLRDHAGRVTSFHSFRRFFCWLVGRTLPIQLVRVLMRHANIQTTVGLYLDLGMTDVAEAVRSLPPLFTAATGASAAG